VRKLVLTALMCLVLGGLGGLLVSTVQNPEPARARFVPPREAAFDFSLKDQNGRRTSLAAARGDVVVMTFIYSSCRDLCPAEGNVIADAVKLAGEQGMQTFVISVDPIGDTPARVKEWLMRRDLPKDGSHYLIGTRKQLRPVWQAYGIVPLVASPAEAKAAMDGSSAFWKQNPYRPGSPKRQYEAPPARDAPAQARESYPDSGDMEYRGRVRHVAGWNYEHSGYVLLIDKHGVQRIGIPFEQLDAASLADDIRVLRIER
jgi:cytochrome oxidase Cu insertion factor (SCO1/SenC/PrrC family)